MFFHPWFEKTKLHIFSGMYILTIIVCACLWGCLVYKAIGDDKSGRVVGKLPKVTRSMKGKEVVWDEIAQGSIG